MRPKVVAHRGASYLAPENTLAAFRKAVELGVDGIEFDTLLTADGHLVVHHEYITDLHANAEEVIPFLTLEQLKQLDFGSWKDSAFAGEPIPTFEEALEVCAAVDTIQVEFKSPLHASGDADQERFAELIVEKVESSGLADKIIVTSFNHSMLGRVRRLAPQLRIGVLTLNSLDSYLAPPPALLELLGLENSPQTQQQLTQSAMELAGGGLDEENALFSRWVMDRVWALTSDYPGQNLFELIGSLFSQHDLAAYVAALDYKPEYLSCQYNTCFRDRTLIQRVQAMGIKAAPWPVDGKLDLKSILDMQPDTIVTNRPERLLEMLDGME